MIAELRAVWEAASRPAVTLESELAPDELRALRQRFESSRPRESWRPSHHRCRIAELEAERVVTVLTALASDLTGLPLRCEAAAARSYDPGGYALLADDDASPRAGLELCLDFSEHARAASGLAYCAGRQPYFAMPQRPGVVALVSRAPDVRRFMPYLKRFTNGPPPRVHLLILGLAPQP